LGNSNIQIFLNKKIPRLFAFSFARTLLKSDLSLQPAGFQKKVETTREKMANIILYRWKIS